MTGTDGGGEVVTLLGGIPVAVDVLRFAWGLEERGVELRVDGDALVVRPKQILSDADVVFLKQHRAELKRIATHRAPEF